MITVADARQAIHDRMALIAEKKVKYGAVASR